MPACKKRESTIVLPGADIHIRWCLHPPGRQGDRTNCGGVGGRVEVKALERDRHGRLIAEVRAGSVDVNATLAEEGHAWAYRKYIPETLRSRYVEAEALAEQSWKGLRRPARKRRLRRLLLRWAPWASDGQQCQADERPET